MSAPAAAAHPPRALAVPHDALRALRTLLARVPRVAWLCALLALLNGLAWSLIVPPFQVPDENAHYAYVQQLAERGTLPHTVLPEGPLSPREDAMLSALLSYGIIGHRDNPAPYSAPQQSAIDAAAAAKLSPLGSGDALSATANPPLYYALEAVPYKLGGESVLTKLALMRVVSAVMGAITVLLIFLFLSELLPGTPLAWAAGALLAAFQPLFAFMSGGVNNDNLLYLTAAGTLWAIARAFRRGLSPPTGVALGLMLGVGLISKLTLIGFLPAAALALVLLVRRAVGPARRVALRGAAWAVALSAAPVLLYVILDRTVWSRSLIPGGVGSIQGAHGLAFSVRGEIDHVWQLFLPRLWDKSQFSYSPLAETWFTGLVGHFGWVDYGFASWVYRVALVVWVAAGLLALLELVRRRRALRSRLGELTVYVAALGGLCVEIGIQSYRFMVGGGGVFEQARYLLPVLALYAAVGALAVRAGGRRWGPVIAIVLVIGALGHDLYAQAITIARYYA